MYRNFFKTLLVILFIEIFTLFLVISFSDVGPEIRESWEIVLSIPLIIATSLLAVPDVVDVFPKMGCINVLTTEIPNVFRVTLRVTPISSEVRLKTLKVSDSLVSLTRENFSDSVQFKNALLLSKKVFNGNTELIFFLKHEPVEGKEFEPLSCTLTFSTVPSTKCLIVLPHHSDGLQSLDGDPHEQENQQKARKEIVRIAPEIKLT